MIAGGGTVAGMETDVRPLPTPSPFTGSGHPPSPAGAPGGDAVPAPGRRGVVAADPRLGDVRGEAGFYHYGPYDAVALAASRSVEDAWFLFAEGRLPSAAERSTFTAAAGAARDLP